MQLERKKSLMLNLQKVIEQDSDESSGGTPTRTRESPNFANEINRAKTTREFTQSKSIFEEVHIPLETAKDDNDFFNMLIEGFDGH
jgi:hypothetical protein